MLKAAASHDAWTPAVIAVALALGGATLLSLAALPGFAPDAAVVLAWVAGWVCVVWSALSAALALGLLSRSRGDGASVAPSAWAVAIAIALLVITVVLHPPFGSGAA
ncbi:hypothetical protein [Agrococcus sp. HG114]|uniref:hypothetical protein n=1 Tax=Agrococcus sp. HG114 TaxID=2969757 RepID=UPI00215A5B40|nr:hypothetical protein [Agrococcus sp. HG114]MCR8670799.1 hypothetical protein [Agrococcus sp. HG114]